MTFPAQNLHGFVLNLLGNDAAREAFGADPARALSDAGLQDITPQDVQEVLPLVLDYAPSMPALGGADALQAMSAVQQLQAVARAADSSPQEFTGAFTGEAPFGEWAAAGTASADGGEFAGTYDSDMFDGAGNAALGTDGAAGSVTAGSAKFGSFSAGGHGAPGDASFGGAFASEPLGAAGQGMFATDGGEFASALSSDSPLGEFGLSFTGSADGFSGNLEAAGQDFGDAKGAAVPGTIAGFASGEDAFSDILPSDMPGPAAGTPLDSLTDTAGAAADQFASQLPRNAAPENGSASAQQDARADTPDHQAPLDAPNLPQGLPQDLPQGLAQNLPQDVPQNLPQDLPQDLPQNLPQDLPQNLPQDVPEDVPSELPDLPVANPLPEDAPASVGRADADAQASGSDASGGPGDLVSDSPVGHAAPAGDAASDMLSSPTHAVDDLPL